MKLVVFIKKWIEQKKRTNVKPKTIQSYENYLNKAIDEWGQRNISKSYGSKGQKVSGFIIVSQPFGSTR